MANLQSFMLLGHSLFGPEYEERHDILVDAPNEESIARYFGGRYCPDRKAIELPKELFKRVRVLGNRYRCYQKNNLCVWMTIDPDRFVPIRKAEKLIITN